MTRRPARAGLFHGVWLDAAGKKQRRIRRDEYPELYRLWRQHQDIRLGLTPVGSPPNTGGLIRGAGMVAGENPAHSSCSHMHRGETPVPLMSSYRHGNLNGDAA